MLLAIGLTVVLVDTDAYELTRQVEAGSLGLIQRVVVGSYSSSLYFLLLFPLVLAADSLRAVATRFVKRSTPTDSQPARKNPAWAVLAAPLLVSAVAFAFERSRNQLRYVDAVSTTELDLNVVLVVIDTLRADHLSSYGYPRTTTPHLDQLAERGVRFARCYSHASWTKPSVASLITSLHPTSHGAIAFSAALPESVTTLGERFLKAGFVTYAHVRNPNLKSIFQFDQGFQFYDDYSMRDHLYLAALRELPLVGERLKKLTGRKFNFTDQTGAERANEQIFRWLDRYHDQRFFMYLHYMDPHAPYSAPPPFDTMVTEPLPEPIGGSKRRVSLTRYDAEIRRVDAAMGSLFARLRDLGIDDETVVVVTSDHGEAFGEHDDWGHDHTIYQDQIHVPLIMRFGDRLQSGARIDAPVRLIDVGPTLLELAGIDAPIELEGTSLLPLIERDPKDWTPNPVFIDHSAAKQDHRLLGLIVDDWKYIRNLDAQLQDPEAPAVEMLFDLSRDPGELEDLAAAHPEKLDALRQQLFRMNEKALQQAVAPTAATDLDSETENQLKALGYIGD